MKAIIYLSSPTSGGYGGDWLDDFKYGWMVYDAEGDVHDEGKAGFDEVKKARKSLCKKYPDIEIDYTNDVRGIIGMPLKEEPSGVYAPGEGKAPLAKPYGSEPDL